MTGLVSFARGIPILVLSPAAGVLIDRLDRRRFLIANQALFGAVSLALATLILTGLIAPWQLLVAAFFSGSAFAMILPTRQAMMPGLVGRAHLTNAVALHSMCGSISRILGPSVAGALIGFVGVASFYLQAASALSALWMTTSMRTPPDAGEAARETVWQNLRAGFAYIRADKSVAGILILGSMISLFAAPYSSMLPVLARDVFGVDASGLGVLLATMGTGSLIGSFSLAVWASPPRRGVLLIVSVLIFSLAIVALELDNSYVVACLAMAVVGVSFAFNLALSNTLLHIVVPDALRGRVMSSYTMTIGLLPVGSLVVGAIAELRGAPLAVGLGGGICALSAVLIAILVPQVRALR